MDATMLAPLARQPEQPPTPPAGVTWPANLHPTTRWTALTFILLVVRFKQNSLLLPNRHVQFDSSAGSAMLTGAPRSTVCKPRAGYVAYPWPQATLTQRQTHQSGYTSVWGT